MIPKYRAWDKRWKEWLTDCYVGQDGRVYRFSKETSYGNAVRLETRDDIILMQSTGLFDKNGVEIFEGDVVLENGWLRRKVSFGTQEVEENFGDTRIFQGFNLYLGGGYPTAVMSDFEVLGNIYEHPHLLE